MNIKQLSQQALEYSRLHVLFSTNLNEILENDLKMELVSRMNQMRLNEVSSPEYSLAWINDIAQMALSYQVGNCCEKTCVAYQFLYQAFLNSPYGNASALELYNDPFSDHFFLVIGRDENTNPCNPLTWNKDTIICDPWAETHVYYLNEVDFNNMSPEKFHALFNLYDFPGHEGLLILEKEILASAIEDGASEEKIIKQSVFVQRNRLDFAKGFQIYNSKVPITIEAWHLPRDDTVSFKY